jgi:hypothetical protein
MLRKTVVVLAIALALGSSGLSANAFARGRGGGRIAGDGYSAYGGHVSALRGGFHRDRPRDVWGHWGAYYGPMIQ